MAHFNGDTFIPVRFLQLAKQFNCKTAVETGTYHGDTTVFLAENFNKVLTIECNNSYLTVAKSKVKSNNVQFVLGSTERVAVELFDGLPKDESCIFFLDAHWGGYCPLLDELDAIAKTRSGKDVILIHDFKVPGKNFGYDVYNGQDFDFAWIKPKLDDIYGESGYAYEYNEEANGSNRGVIYIYRKAL